jgi:hypothetical protein
MRFADSKSAPPGRREGEFLACLTGFIDMVIGPDGIDVVFHANG